MMQGHVITTNPTQDQPFLKVTGPGVFSYPSSSSLSPSAKPIDMDVSSLFDAIGTTLDMYVHVSLVPSPYFFY